MVETIELAPDSCLPWSQVVQSDVVSVQQNTIVQGFIVYSRIDNFQGWLLAQTEQSIQKMMICTAAQPSPHHHHGKQFVTPLACPLSRRRLTSESYGWWSHSAEMNLHQTSLKHFSTANLEDHSMACSFI